MNTLKLKLETLIKETSQEVNDIFKREQGSSLYHYTQGKLNAYREVRFDLDKGKDISQEVSESNLAFIRVTDDKGKQHFFPTNKIDYVNADTELLTIYVIVESGESYGIFFHDDEKFQLQLDYLHKQLNIQ